MSLQVPPIECYGLRDYGIAGQIGLESTPAEYISRMVEVFEEVKRVLTKDGTCFVNLGDSYAGSGKGGNPQEGKQATNAGSQTIGVLYDKVGESARQAAVTNVTRSPIGFKPKDLMMMPARVAIALQDAGWYLRSDIIWHKPNPMPESVTDRPTTAHEHIFLLTKSATYFYDADAIREPGDSNSSGGRIALDHRLTSGAEMVRKPAGWKTGLGSHGNIHEHGRAQEIEYSEVERDGRNARNVWTIPSQPYPEAHFATYPEEIPRRCILAGCPEKVCKHCKAGFAKDKPTCKCRFYRLRNGVPDAIIDELRILGLV